MFFRYFSNNSKKKFIRETSITFGKPFHKNRNFFYIKTYYEQNLSKIKIIDNKSWGDLEMNKVFEFIDRTYSKTGEQYLFNLLHIKQPEKEFEALNQKVKYYENNLDKFLNNAFLLKKYNSSTTYTLPNFLFGNIFFKIPKWTFLLSFIAFLFGVLTLILNSFFIYFIAIGMVNTLLHYYFKKKINNYYYDFINVKSFYNLYNNLTKNDNETGIISNYDKVKLKTIYHWCLYLNMNFEFADELTSLFYYLIEIIKGWFLIDVILFNKTITLIKQNSNLLHNVFCYIGTIDTALSIVSLKQGTCGCEPIYTIEKKITLTNAYHPLIENCIPNSISLESNNGIITGGNMSGKTTFLKTVGINILLSQTINYSFSDKIVIPHLSVLSSITNEDDLEAGKSFFMNELLRAKTIFETIKSSNITYLVLFDEIFKGTNTKDRITLASAVLINLAKNNCIVLCTTHDLQIINFLTKKYETYYFGNTFINDKIIFDHKIRKGIQNKTNVFELIKSLNFPNEIITEMFKFNKMMIKSP